MGGAAWESIFDALKDEHRRRLLVELLEEGDVPRITAADSGTGDPTVLQAKLVHTHLPKLEAEGYIDWQRDEDRVTRGPNFDEIRPVLRALHDRRDDLPDGWARRG